MYLVQEQMNVVLKYNNLLMIKVVPQCNYVIISLTLTDCRGVLIPKLVSNLAVSDSSLIFFSFSLFLILSYLQIRIIHSLLYFLNYIG